jgi:aminocarboxymuconate-semialdehyde decarboxylase
MLKIDFHNHFYPAAYLQALEKGDTHATVQKDGQGRTLLVYAGDYNIIVPEHYDPEARIAALDKVGMDMQVLTLTTPGVHIETPARGLALAQRVNDAFADLASHYPTRFTALAALPLQDPAASVQELERAVTQLGLPGAMLFTNVNGVPLDDPRFWPLYEKAAGLEAPLFLHPGVPAEIGAMNAYRLVALVGFLHETTVVAARLVFSGVLERWPNLKLVLSHLGGNLPYVAERIDLGFRVYPECQHLSQPPSHSLKQFYMDTIPYSPKALAFALEFAGPDKFLLGSDYPHQIGDLAGALQTIETLAIPAEDKAKIMGQNVARLLKLNV